MRVARSFQPFRRGVKILLPTVYQAIGGSTRVLQAAQRALAPSHETIVRAPFSDSNERLPYFFPADTLASAGQKLSALPGLLKIALHETAALRGRGFHVIYVHDEPSLYVYGIVARFVGAKVVRHGHLRGSVKLESIRSALTDYEIYISEHDRGHPRGTLIRNPVQLFDLARSPKAGEIVVAGSICRRKNQLLAVETFARLQTQGFRGVLRLCGGILEPDYAAAVRARAEALGAADEVRFEGMVSPRDYLTTASALLMPSVYENQPLAVLEAIAAQVPVVVSDIAAHRELAELGCLDARFIQPLETASFAAAVMSVNASSAHAERVRSVFSEERFAQELRAFFDTIAVAKAA